MTKAEWKRRILFAIKCLKKHPERQGWVGAVYRQNGIVKYCPLGLAACQYLAEKGLPFTCDQVRAVAYVTLTNTEIDSIWLANDQQGLAAAKAVVEAL